MNALTDTPPTSPIAGRLFAKSAYPTHWGEASVIVVGHDWLSCKPDVVRQDRTLGLLHGAAVTIVALFAVPALPHATPAVTQIETIAHDFGAPGWFEADRWDEPVLPAIGIEVVKSSDLAALAGLTAVGRHLHIVEMPGLVDD